jgi:dihydrofolate synthase / folylpolyglutamate synthase
MDYARAKEFLFGLKGGGAKYGIDRMRLFVDRLGHPERRLKVIHVAGTNGKGSVCAMCESIARTAGYRTGLYTSPHLIRLGERVQVDRRILTEQEIVSYTEELRKVAQAIGDHEPTDHPTFFEFMTAMAFLHFVRKEVDVAVVEVGLGGRLDATNVVDPAVSVITSIGLDHCEQLGDTLGAIAGEKAGIIKPGRPVVMGILPPEAEEVVRAVAAERNAPFFSVEERFGADPSAWPATVLAGEHQRLNAGTAALVFEVLGNRLPVAPDAVTRGLMTVEWAARWEERKFGGRRMILEAAHNPQGAEVLDRQLASLVAGTGRKPVIAVGALGEVRARALLEVVARHAKEIHLFMPQQSRATPFEVLEGFVPASFRGRVERRRVEEAFGPGRCALGEPEDLVVVTGSIYLIGEILERLEEPLPVQEGRLQD